jgi:hypothetical protein
MKLSLRKFRWKTLFIGPRIMPRKKWRGLLLAISVSILALSMSGCFIPERDGPSKERKGSGTKVNLPQEKETGKTATEGAQPPANSTR